MTRTHFSALALAALVALAPAASAQIMPTPDGTFASGLSAPDNIVQLSDGRILVSEIVFGPNSITAFDPDGTNLGTFATVNTGFGIEELADGRVLISSTDDDAVYAFASDGTPLGLFAAAPPGVSFFSLIEQLADGTILIADQDANVVYRFDTAGTLLGSFATFGSGSPYGTYQLADGSVLVSLFNAGTIEQFASDGTPIGTFASGLNGPSVIAPLADGTILVLNAFGGTISQFQTDGTPLGTYASGFSGPFGLRQIADGRVLVADSNNGTVVFFGEAAPTTDIDIAVNTFTRNPMRGESVFFRGPVTNNGAATQDVYVYAIADIPGGQTYQRNLGRVTLAPGQTFQYKNFQNSKNYVPLPLNSPEGTYTVTVYAASDRFGTEVYDTDSFQFTLGPVVMPTVAAMPENGTASLEAAEPGAAPNPFRDATEIAYALAEDAPVDLRVYDVTGREVASLVSGTQSAGTHSATFRAGDLPGGVYVWRLAIGGDVTTGRVTLSR